MSASLFARQRDAMQRDGTRGSVVVESLVQLVCWQFFQLETFVLRQKEEKKKTQRKRKSNISVGRTDCGFVRSLVLRSCNSSDPECIEIEQESGRVSLRLCEISDGGGFRIEARSHRRGKRSQYLAHIRRVSGDDHVRIEGA